MLGVGRASRAGLPDVLHQDSSHQTLPQQPQVIFPAVHASGAALPDVVCILLISDLGDGVSLLPKKALRAELLEGLKLLLQRGGQLVLSEGIGRLPLALGGAYLQRQWTDPY